MGRRANGRKGRGCGCVLAVGIGVLGISVVARLGQTVHRSDPALFWAGCVVLIVIMLIALATVVAAARERKRHAAREASAGEAATFDWRRFRCYVRGTDRKNEDGSSRQKIVRRCRAGTGLELRLEPENPVDPNAIQVWVIGGGMVGYIGKDTAAWLHNFIALRGVEYDVRVLEVVKNRGRRGRGLFIELRAR